jgi:DNA-directed RNA polymerase specialized sigma24 family protein
VHDQPSRYFDAAQYCCEVLGDDAPRYFPRLHQLSQHNSPEELQAIIDSWCPASQPTAPSSPAPGLWLPGSTWGSAVRVARDRGIIWKLKCACGKNFELSTNDTIPEDRRKCPACVFANQRSETRRQIIFKLERTSATVLAWHRDFESLIWDRVYKALRSRDIDNAPEFARDLNALCWVKITEKAGQYRDRGFKPSAWLGRVADNCLSDFFKVTSNRQRLAPTVPLVSEEGRDAVAPATKAEEILPARPIRPEGASGNDRALNSRQTRWDRTQNWNR